MVVSMVTVIPIEDPFGPAAISVLLDECPLPSKETVIRMTQYLGLSAKRTNLRHKRTRVERNICITLGCIAEKLVGPNSEAILTENTLDYLLAYL
ncbi:jg114, partial [Pararge aegeria aegeria]